MPCKSYVWHHWFLPMERTESSSSLQTFLLPSVTPQSTISRCVHLAMMSHLDECNSLLTVPLV